MLRIFVFFAAVLGCLPGITGTIGFSVQFQGANVSLQNTGNESAFNVSLYTLNDQNIWQKNLPRQDASSNLSPQAKLETRGFRASDVNASWASSIDPLLVLFNDQSGSAMTQLAWRKAPPHALFTLSYDRQGTQLRIHPPSSDAASKIVRTHAIVVPYAGIAALAKPLQPIPTPPAPISMRWQNGSSTPQALWVETGEGLSGAWLLHESPNGELSLQVITDGKQRGSEQIPTWLLAVRKFGLLLANWLWVFGLLTMAFSVWLFKRQGKSPT